MSRIELIAFDRLGDVVHVCHLRLAQTVIHHFQASLADGRPQKSGHAQNR